MHSFGWYDDNVWIKHKKMPTNIEFLGNCQKFEKKSIMKGIYEFNYSVKIQILPRFLMWNTKKCVK